MLILFPLCFVLTWVAGAIPQEWLTPFARLANLAPGIQAFASVTPRPAAASTGFAIALLFALAILVVAILMPFPPDVRQRAFEGYTGFRKGLYVVAGLLLIAGPLLYAPGPVAEYRLAHHIDKLFSKSHMAVSVFCAGVCIYTAAALVFIWMVLHKREKQ
jgi:hypothetical protein